jgi:tRNA(fMet)-specific endonuclease VapC
MPTYMLDTNMCVYLMKNQPPQVALRMADCHEGEGVLSAITLAELEYGVTVSAEPWKARAALRALVARVPVLPLTATAARHMGQSAPPCASGRQMRWIG